MNYIVTIKSLKKTFPSKKGPVEAVRGLNLAVRKGEIFGFLGPNGAGKTTTLRMLTTFLPIDSGEVVVADYDVKKEPDEVRKRIGYVSQTGGSDRNATGFENLMMQGQLYGMQKMQAKARTDELVAIFDLGECIGRLVSTYSGGQRRRLDVALGMMHKPQVLFLDEPTTGLDPQNRANLWEQIRMMRQEGTTIFLTTHYLEEADALSDRLAIMDHGQIVTEGSARELKKQVAGDVVTVGLTKDHSLNEETLNGFKDHAFVREVTFTQDLLRIYVEDGEAALPQILRFLDQKKISLQTIALSVPTLDDVFLRQTGKSLRET